MPYIATRTSVAISARKEQAIKERMGEAIALIPGKSEGWLMLSFEDNLSMYFKGSEEPCAICQVQLYGSAAEEDYAALSEQLTDILYEELGIPTERIYITYTEIGAWGWNGGML